MINSRENIYTISVIHMARKEKELTTHPGPAKEFSDRARPARMNIMVALSRTITRSHCREC